MYIYMYIYIHIYLCIYIYTYIYVYIKFVSGVIQGRRKLFRMDNFIDTFYLSLLDETAVVVFDALEQIFVFQRRPHPPPQTYADAC